MWSQNEALDFARLFSGAIEFYGSTKIGELDESKQKVEGISQTVHQEPVPTTYIKHISGEESIGISPLKADNSIRFGAIDIDDYKGDLMKIVKAIYHYDLPICPCWSKSRKLHLYFFFEIGTQAEDAVDIMRQYANDFGLSKKVEIFPKQTVRKATHKAYSWINLPYFNAGDDTNHRKMVKENGELASLREFIERANNVKFDIEQHKLELTKLPMRGAPPCIQRALLFSDVPVGSRNNFLYNCAVFLYQQDSERDMAEDLRDVNDLLPDPIDDHELQMTVVSTFTSNPEQQYYKCGQSGDYCNQKECSNTEFGLGKNLEKEVDRKLELGQMTKVETDPPSYKWEVNNITFEFENEKDLIGQNKFRELCFRNFGILPVPKDDRHWSGLLTKYGTGRTSEYSDSKGGDFTAGAQFFDLVCQFFGVKRRAKNLSQVSLGRVWEDVAQGEFVFTSTSFLQFMSESKGFKGFSNLEMRRRLIEWGGEKRGSYWYLPTSVIPKEQLEEKKIDYGSLDNTEEGGDSRDF